MKSRSATFSALVRRPWLALLLAWSVLVGQLLVPGTLLAAVPSGGTISICTGSGIVAVPDPAGNPAKADHRCHDLCGLCCSIGQAPLALCPPTVARLLEPYPAQAPPAVPAVPGVSLLFVVRPPGNAPPAGAV